MDELDGEAACERFRQIVNDRFRFLTTTYGLEEAETGCMGAEIWVVFHNQVTQVNVHFEYGRQVWLTVGRAVNGRQVNLNLLLRVRAPHQERTSIVADFFDPQQIEEIMRERSDALREQSDDLLRGDFTMFPKLLEVQAELSAKKFRELAAKGLWP
jgi:hypothetical protein